LKEFHNKHNHELSKHDGKDRITPEILQGIKNLRGACKNDGALTEAINKQYGTNFKTQTIHYQTKLLEEGDNGPPSQDAETLRKALKEDCFKHKYFYKEKIINNQLKSLFFMTKRMKLLAETFNDVVFLDSTHKTNRFNLPLLDAVIINNFGKTSTIFWGLLENEKEDSFVWALNNFKSAIGKTPKLVFTDEDDGLINGKF